jgi:serine/threonine-protein kinase RIO1
VLFPIDLPDGTSVFARCASAYIVRLWAFATWGREAVVYPAVEGDALPYEGDVYEVMSPLSPDEDRREYVEQERRRARREALLEAAELSECEFPALAKELRRRAAE